MTKGMQLKKVLGASGPADGPVQELRSAVPQDVAPMRLPYYWDLIRRYKLVLISAACCCSVAAYAFAMMQPKLYRAHAAVEVQGLNGSLLAARSIDPFAIKEASIDKYLQTQVEVIQSESLVTATLQKLKPVELNRLNYRSGREWIKTASKPSLQQLVAEVRDHLHVEPRAGTSIIDISVEMPEAELSSSFVNALTDMLIQRSVETRLRAGAKTRDQLAAQLNVARAALREAEERLVQYTRSSGLIITAETNTVVEEKLRQLQTEMSAAESDLAIKQARYATLMASPAERLPQVLDSPQLHEHQSKLTELRRQRSELESIYTSSNYRVRQIEAQIKELQAADERERQNLLLRIKNDYDAAANRRQLLADRFFQQHREVTRQAGNAVSYNILKRDVDASRQMYDSLLQTFREAGVSLSMVASNIEVLDVAQKPESASSPRPLQNLLAGLLLGGFLGGIVVLLKDRSEGYLRAPGDASLCLGLPELGSIPAIRPASVPYLTDAKIFQLTPDQETGSNPDGVASRELGTIAESAGGVVPQDSEVAESYRIVLASMLTLARRPVAARTFLITSPNAGEGKTTAVAHLAVALARLGYRVLAVDGDLRRPRLHSTLGVPNGVGLRELLLNTTIMSPVKALNEYVQATPNGNLYVLTGGLSKGNSWDLLLPDVVTPLFSYLKTKFDYVLIDSPPVLNAADARILARAADRVILVVRSGSTDRQSAAAAGVQLAVDETPVLGVILNDCDPNLTPSRYYGQYA
jgi:capsular exopolysaccharide synthesis family protein